MKSKSYQLPSHVLEPLLALAAKSDVLLLGEVHGTQEVPGLVAGLLDDLAGLGYAGLALEAHASLRGELSAWAGQRMDPPPVFFSKPYSDGRGNEQALSLVVQAVSEQWQVLCFDIDLDEPQMGWVERDAHMARNLTAQRDTYCAGKKVIGICGNLHSRLTRGTGDYIDLWPSFAESLQRLNPNFVIGTINIAFHRGGFFNGGEIRPFVGEPIAEARIEEDTNGGHSLVLHLPEATPATFLSPPRQ